MQFSNKTFYSLKDYLFTQNVIKSHYPLRYWLNNKNLFLHLTFFIFIVWSTISLFSIFLPISNKHRIGHGAIVAFESAFQYIVKIFGKGSKDDKENLSPVLWNTEAYTYLYFAMALCIFSSYCYRVVSIFNSNISKIVYDEKTINKKFNLFKRLFKVLWIFTLIIVLWTSFSLLYLNKPTDSEIGSILFQKLTSSEKVYHRSLTFLGKITAAINSFWFLLIIFCYFKYCVELFNGNSFFLKVFRFKTEDSVNLSQFSEEVQRDINRSMNLKSKSDYFQKNTPGYIVEIKGVNKYFNVGNGQFHALKDIDLDIKTGDFIVILGYSGSGKTTLLNILAGIDRPTNGKCVISDNNTAIMSDRELNLFRRKKIGYIFQNYALLPNLSAAENISITQNMNNATFSDVLKSVRKELIGTNILLKPFRYSFKIFEKYFFFSQNKDELYKLMGSLNLLEHKDKLPHQLSGGQQQRTSIARALIKKPSILLADEPTGAIDHSMTKSILELFYNINKNLGTTIILITHNPLIAKMAKRVLYVAEGTIVRDVINPKPQRPSEIKGL